MLNSIISKLRPSNLDENLEKQREEQANRADFLAKQRIDDLQWLMADKRGRRIAWRLLSDAGIYKISYAAGLTPQDICFKEGERNFGLKLNSILLENCEENFLQMQKEARNV